MRALRTAMLAGAAFLALTATWASAAVVCNEEGDCWRVRGEPRYEPSLRLRIMPDEWRWKEGERYRWREPGRGNGVLARRKLDRDDEVKLVRWRFSWPSSSKNGAQLQQRCGRARMLKREKID